MVRKDENTVAWQPVPSKNCRGYNVQCTNVIVALSITEKTWKQPRCIVGTWLNYETCTLFFQGDQKNLDLGLPW